MERLTKRISGYAHGAEGITADRLTGAYCRGEFEATACIEKLAEYEDLEEQGRLLKLPCAVGDTVYRINKGAEQPIIPLQVMNFKIFNNDLVESFKMECVDEWDGAYAYRKTDIGRSVFLTKESAEAALKEMSE